MKIKFDDIVNAHMYVSMGRKYEHYAYFNKETGESYYVSELGDSDELPDDIEESEKYVEIPHKNDLDLGAQLVYDFVEEYLPEEYHSVETIFMRSGAYSRYKALLDRKGLLDKWYEFENARETQTLKKWCKENDIDII